MRNAGVHLVAVFALRVGSVPKVSGNGTIKWGTLLDPAQDAEQVVRHFVVRAIGGQNVDVVEMGGKATLVCRCLGPGLDGDTREHRFKFVQRTVK